ncbi:MAG: hypothetical protein U0802_04195 [Candidatus Binatia bacterium]
MRRRRQQLPGGRLRAGEPTVCRAVSGGDVCDVVETCTGSGASCPADAVEPNTTVCRGAAGVCDVAELCDGTNKTCLADVSSRRRRCAAR